MYPVCRGGDIAPGVGRRTEEREAGGRANRSAEGCYRQEKRWKGEESPGEEAEQDENRLSGIQREEER